MPDSTSEMFNSWSESASYWEKHRPLIQEMFGPLSDAIIQGAGIKPGHRVLDIAGGAGEPALSIANVVGSGGRVVQTDFVPEMVAAAKREAIRLGLQNIDFRACAADALPFESESFDVAVCRLGAMFFPEPVAAVREMLRVVRPEGRLAFAVWSRGLVSPFFGIVTEALARFFPPVPEDPDAPGAFRFGTRGSLANLLRQAGAVEIDERVFRFEISAPLDADKFWIVRSELSESLRTRLRQLTPSQINELAQETKSRAQPYVRNSRMTMPAEALILTCERPRS